MFQVVTAANRDLHADWIDEMHTWRKRIFVDELGWKLKHANGRERDQYDDDLAVYIIEYETNGDLVHAQRMRPTASGSMLTDVFGAAIAAGPDSIMDAETWELSRGFVTPTYRSPERDDVRAAMRLAVLQLALKERIKRIVTFVDVRMLPYFVNSAYRFQPLGLPIPYGEGSGIALEIEVSAPAIEHMAATLNIGALRPEHDQLAAVRRPARNAAGEQRGSI